MNEFEKKIKQTLEDLDSQRAHIIQSLFEDEQIFLSEIIIQLVHRARSLTKTIKIFKQLIGNKK